MPLGAAVLRTPAFALFHLAPGNQVVWADLRFCLDCPFFLAKWAIFFALGLHLPDFGRFQPFRLGQDGRMPLDKPLLSPQLQ